MGLTLARYGHARGKGLAAMNLHPDTDGAA